MVFIDYPLSLFFYFCYIEFINLNCQRVCINNPLHVFLASPIIPEYFCLSYGTNDVEHWRILPENAEYGINHSNSVRLPVASSINFPASDALIRRNTDDSERLYESGLMLPYQTI